MKHEITQATISNVSRRGFLHGMASAGAFVLSVRLAPQSLWAEDAPAAKKPGPPVALTNADHAELHPNMFVGINSDGTVWIIAHRSEMGTTSRTSVPLILADELDADWKRVKIEQAVGDERYGDQDTDGSHSVRSFYDGMREAGATARLMLIRAAAQQWGVPAEACETDLHVVVHKASNRRAGYGELVKTAATLPVPKKEELKFKPKSAFRYIGKGTSSYDLTNICTGKAGYGMDAHVEGMLYASVEHPPVLGGKVKSYDQKAPLQVAGVKGTVPIAPFKPPHEFQPLGGVAVVADSTWAAFQGRKKLHVVWDSGPNASYDSEAYKKELQETARKPGKVVRNIGDVDAAFAKGGKIVEAEYFTPHLAHVSMEPPAAVAMYRDGKVEAWAATQNPQAVQDTVAKVMGIPKENVICHVPLLGGGFGRKSKPDYVAEAALVSKAMGKPVKVVWSREDDVQFCYYHSVAAMYLKAALDDKGKPTAWLQRTVFPSIDSTFALNVQYAGAGELGLGWTDVPFDLPNHRAENGMAQHHVRIGWLRSVANIYHCFSVQSFADELAHESGRDSVEYLLELIGPDRIVDVKATAPDYDNYDGKPDQYPLDTARMRRVVQIAAENAGWGKRKLGKGSGMGIAVHRSFLTYVASVVEVEVDDQGNVKIPAVYTALDAGLIVNPEATRNQFEGAAVFGTSLTRTGSITAKGGAIEQSNFHDYPVARMNDAPYKTHVHIVDSDAPPAGVGEPGVPPMAPAICNAVFAATGKRVRELPLPRAKLGA
jgi:isoquinoline 1-oxidoreductase beta subunit